MQEETQRERESGRDEKEKGVSTEGTDSMHEWQMREKERHNKSKQREFWKNALRDGINVHTVCCVDRNRRQHTHTLAAQEGENKETGKMVGVDDMMPAPDEVPPKTIAQARKRPRAGTRQLEKKRGHT